MTNETEQGAGQVFGGAAGKVPVGRERPSLWVLLIGNFIVGTGVLLPAGLLNDISSEFSVRPSSAGLLMLVGGIVVAIGAPVLAGATSAFDRRRLLAFALLLYAIGHLLSALVTSFAVLVLLRGVTVVGAAIFTPQAAATVGLLVPVEKRAGAIAFIFIGWSASSVVGIPLGSYLASHIGWRLVFGGMALASALTMLVVWRVLRPGLFGQSLSFAAWKSALTNPLILAVLLVTLLSLSGQMTVFSYIAPILTQAFAGGPEMISLTFAVAGIFGLIGNAIASRIVGGFGISQAIALAIICLMVGLGIFAASFGVIFFALVGVALWGLGSFSSNSLQQSRLVAIAPALAAATVALNTSVVYLGQAIGAGLGGWLIAGGATPIIAWTACSLTIAALLVSLIAQRFTAP